MLPLSKRQVNCAEHWLWMKANLPAKEYHESCLGSNTLVVKQLRLAKGSFVQVLVGGIVETQTSLHPIRICHSKDVQAH